MQKIDYPQVYHLGDFLVALTKMQSNYRRLNMTQNYMKDNSTLSKDFIKRDTFRKYHNNRSGKPKPKYMNISGVTLTIGINLDKQLQHVVKDWFKKHLADKVDELKFSWQRKKVVSLIKHLSRTYSDYFEKKEGSNITNTCMAIIQRTFSNDRQNEKAQWRRQNKKNKKVQQRRNDTIVSWNRSSFSPAQSSEFFRTGMKLQTHVVAMKYGRNI